MTPRLDELKQKLLQLEELGRSGVLGPEALGQARSDIEKQIVELVMKGAAPAAPAAAAAAASVEPVARASGAQLGAIAVFVLVFGALGYAWLGNFQGVSVAPGQVVAAPEAAASASAHSLDVGQIEGMAAKLAERLKDKPDDAEGWMMLGRSYAVLNRFPEAAPAYKRVVELRPNDAQALADYADALGMANNRSLDGEPAQLIDKALKLDPKNAKALSLGGTIAFRKGDFTGAAKLWEVAVSVSDPASELVRNLNAGIGEAREKAGLPPLPSAAPPVAQAAPAEPAPAAAGVGAEVSGRVSLAAGLKAKAAPDDTVFIFARPASGPKMPLAIIKRQVKDLPIDFTLDDSMAMSPAAKLSGAPQVVVGARISKSGNAMPQPGDLQGLSAVVAPGAKGLAIEITEEVK